jgi:hypothetical protein
LSKLVDPETSILRGLQRVSQLGSCFRGGRVGTALYAAQRRRPDAVAGFGAWKSHRKENQPMTWTHAVESAADALGEMLIELAEGRGDHSNEDIAAAVLTTGLAALLEADPASDRLETVASVLYAKLHDGGEQSWTSLTQIEKGFWLDLAGAAIEASDAALLRETGASHIS